MTSVSHNTSLTAIGRLSQRMARCIAGVLLALVTTMAAAEWTPPAQPDPIAILQEARADRAAKRYADALAKHLWFHQNALTYIYTLYGVRLSFALEDWKTLAQQYPPALQALNALKDETAARLKGATASRDDFDDYRAINRVLKKQADTSALFVWLDGNNPELARETYESAQPSLVMTQNYALCGKYIVSDLAAKDLIQYFRQNLETAKDKRFGEPFRNYAGRSMTSGAATLVALLVLNQRADEADTVIAAVSKEWPDQGFRKALTEARKGVLPKPGPGSYD